MYRYFFESMLWSSETQVTSAISTNIKVYRPILQPATRGQTMRLNNASGQLSFFCLFVFDTLKWWLWMRSHPYYIFWKPKGRQVWNVSGTKWNRKVIFGGDFHPHAVWIANEAHPALSVAATHSPPFRAQCKPFKDDKSTHDATNAAFMMFAGRCYPATAPVLEIMSEICAPVSLKVLHPSCDQLKPPGPRWPWKTRSCIISKGVVAMSTQQNQDVLTWRSQTNTSSASLSPCSFASRFCFSFPFCPLHLSAALELPFCICLGNQLMNLLDLLTVSKPFWIGTSSDSCRNLSDNPEIICFH